MAWVVGKYRVFIPYARYVINEIIVACALNLHYEKFILSINTSDSLTVDAGALMRRASLCSLIVGAVLVIMKLIAWAYTDSLSMMSSLADSVLDVITSTINFVAVRYALQPADEEHRFGHGKAEDIATFAQSAFICASGLFLIYQSVRRLSVPAEVHNSMLGVGVMVVSTLLSISLVAYQKSVVRRTSSSVIAADAMHYFIDFLTNLGVIVALILTSALGWKSADPLIALAIAVYIIYGAFGIGGPAFQNLMDREFSDEERERIKGLVNADAEVIRIHELRTRRSGLQGFIQFHMDLPENITLKHAHEITDRIEAVLQAGFPNAEIIIHPEPVAGVKG